MKAVIISLKRSQSFCSVVFLQCNAICNCTIQWLSTCAAIATVHLGHFHHPKRNPPQSVAITLRIFLSWGFAPSGQFLDMESNT